MAKDELTDLFRARFHGHEVEVDPGVWEGIQSQLTLGAVAEGMDPVNEVFRTRFEGYEMDVDPGVWQGIESRMADGAAAGGSSGTGWSLLGKVAAVTGTVVVATTLYFTLNVQPAAPESGVVEAVSEASAATPEAPGAAVETASTPASMPQEEREPGSAPSLLGTAQVPASVPQDAPAAGTPPMEVAHGGAERPAETVVHTPAAHTAPPHGAGVDPAKPAEGTPAPGAAIVESIIADMTTQVERQVRARDKAPVGVYAEPQAEEQATEPPLEDRYRIYLQNAFTPNGDGINDQYVVERGDFAQMRIRIFSVRNGQLVFSTDTNEPWSGEGFPDGHYSVAVEAVTPEGRLFTAGQVVWLTRDSYR